MAAGRRVSAGSREQRSPGFDVTAVADIASLLSAGDAMFLVSQRRAAGELGWQRQGSGVPLPNAMVDITLYGATI